MGKGYPDFKVLNENALPLTEFGGTDFFKGTPFMTIYLILVCTLE